MYHHISEFLMTNKMIDRILREYQETNDHFTDHNRLFRTYLFAYFAILYLHHDLLRILDRPVQQALIEQSLVDWKYLQW